MIQTIIVSIDNFLNSYWLRLVFVRYQNESLSSGYKCIRINKPAHFRIIVSALEVVQPRLGIVDIPSVSQGIEGAEVFCGGVGCDKASAPGNIGAGDDLQSVRITALHGQ